ncbi:membrane protein [Aliidongia dinghuensis]|uniref:Membrane protein n=1 Tax=Aliidongia dinghuensis TaxID=1867774 RepID=A0A8J2YTW1_9PROT|nr:cellulose biosynthesis cyclic di-GMP-binding regulatory protein BcsB [Aliidongia dinghuensis]GGF19924.1 membrane protein [Aliidongia dinghuensis]
MTLGTIPSARIRRFLLIASIAPLLAAAAGPSAARPPAEAASAADFFLPRVAGPEIVRRVALADLGFTSAIDLTGSSAERQFFLPVPRGAHIEAAVLDLVGQYLQPTPGRTTFVVDIDGNPVVARPLDAGSGVISEHIPISLGTHSDGFVQVDMRFASVVTTDRCTDERAIGNGASIAPETALTYHLALSEIRDVRTAWSVLPNRPVVLLPPGEMGPVQYDAAIRIALALRAAGRDAVFANLPAIGDSVSVAGLSVPPALAALPVFRKFANAIGTVRLDAPATRGAYMILRVLANQQLADLVVGDGWFGALVATDLDELKASLQPENPAAARALDAWLKAVNADPTVREPGENLSLHQVLGQPVIALDADTAPVAAALLGSPWTRLARSSSLDIRSVGGSDTGANWIPLTQLGSALARQDIVDRGDWQVSFTTAQLPTDRWPSAVELEMTVAPDPADTAPVASVSLNDTLLRAEKVASGGVTRMIAQIPPYVLRANNTLKVSIQRAGAAGDCRLAPRGFPAQMLPTSRLVLSERQIKNQFFALEPRFARRGIVAVPQRYLTHPLASLPLVEKFLVALGFTPQSIRLAVLDENTLFQPDDAFVAFDHELMGVVKRATLDSHGLAVATSDGKPVVSAAGTADMVLAQIVDYANQPGVAVDTPPSGALPEIQLPSLSNGDLALVDRQGLIAELGGTDQYQAALRQAIYAPSAVFFRYQPWILSGLGLLSALIVMRLIRAVVVHRKRRKSGG